MNSIYSVVNGEFILKDEAAIAISDLAIMRGFGVFDFFRTINYQPVFLEDHFDRFYFSASEVLMDVGYERNQLHKIIQQLIDKNRFRIQGSGSH